MTRMLLPQNLRPLRSLRASFAPSSPPIFVPKQRDQCINCQSQLRLAAFGVWGRDFVAVFNAIYHNSSTILTSCKKLRCFHYVRNIITFQPQPCVSVYCITVIWYILTTTFHYSINQLIFLLPGLLPTEPEAKNFGVKTWDFFQTLGILLLAPERLGGSYSYPHLAPVGFGNWFIMNGWQMI